MSVQVLSLSDIVACYETYLIHDFPANEIRSLQSIKKLVKEGLYKGYGYVQDNTLLAYAFCVQTPTHHQLLLDYFAVIQTHREKGIGSLFLKQLTAQLEVNGIIIEVETPDQVIEPQEKMNRQRRIAFYERNGAHLTNVGGNIFGVHFTLMHLPIQEMLLERDLLETIQALYKKIVPSHLYEQYVHYQSLK